MDIFQLTDKLLPANESPEAVRRYRLGIAAAALSAFVLSSLILLAMSVGWPRLGSLAWAGEVDEKVARAVKPINEQLGEIQSQLKRSETRDIASELRDLHRLKCATTDSYTRERMARDVEEAQQQYRKLTGERYPLPACQDL